MSTTIPQNIIDTLGYSPSNEQAEIVDSIFTQQSPRTVISAAAGSGKTSTLLLLSHMAQAQDLPPNVLYLVFSKAMQLESESKFSGLAEVRTIDSIALQLIKAKCPAKVTLQSRDGYWFNSHVFDTCGHPKGKGGYGYIKGRNAPPAIANYIADEPYTVGTYDSCAARNLYKLQASFNKILTGCMTPSQWEDHCEAEYGDDGELYKWVYSANYLCVLEGILRLYQTGETTFSLNTFVLAAANDITDDWIDDICDGVDVGDRAELYKQAVYHYRDMSDVAIAYTLIMVDECQDLSTAKLAMCRAMVGVGSQIAFVGDECQPIGTVVRCIDQQSHRMKGYRGPVPTTYKNVNIEDLKVGDLVHSYALADSAFYAKPITGISSRPYEGDLIVASLENGSISKYTPNHKCLASFNGLRGQYMLYLMKRGDQYRIGISTFHDSSNKTGLSGRMIQESADSAWILSVYKNRDDAWIAEQYYSTHFGIPQMIFDAERAGCKDPALYEMFWNAIGDNSDRALSCLQFFGRCVQYPLFTSDCNHNSLKRPRIVRACNLITGCLVLPMPETSRNGDHFGAYNARKADWVNATITREHYEGDVFSLTVDTHHTYVADGIVTHNCQAIFSFAGADSQSFAKIVEYCDGNVLPLSTCYRCDRSIVEWAQDYRSDIRARDGACEGYIDYAKSVNHIEFEEWLFDTTKSRLLITRNNKPLTEMFLSLYRSGIKFRMSDRKITSIIDDGLRVYNVYAEEAGLSKVMNAKQWGNINARCIGAVIAEIDYQLGQTNEPHEIEQLKGHSEELHGFAMLFDIFGAKTSDKEHMVDVMRKRLIDPNSTLLLSTAHSSKGLEAESVIILGWEAFVTTEPTEWQLKRFTPEEIIQEQNLSYVAGTRAKKELCFVLSSTVEYSYGQTEAAA
jgi:hypothetical protein